MKFNVKRTFFAVVLGLLVIGFLEMTLNLLSLVSPKVSSLLASPWTETRPTIPDGRLGFRPNPDFPAHDHKGFRNPAVPAKADIVALGDSQTYGTGVSAENAWPRLLESMIQSTVYSMAYGGFGPAHSLILWDEAVALSPKIVIEAFYAGNDLYDSFNLVYNLGKLADLKSPDSQLRARIREAEQFESIEAHVGRMYLMGKTPVIVDGEASRAARRGVFFFVRFIQKQSRIYGLLRRAQYEITHWAAKRKDARPAEKPSRPANSPQAEWEEAKAFAQAHAAYCQVFSEEPLRTIFTSEYRLSALDLSDIRVAEGLRISLEAIQQMNDSAVAGNIRFLVVMIPTKETVFRELWRSPSQNYLSLMENEERMWRLTREFLEQNRIEYLDALPVLRESLAARMQPYQVSTDGHPNEAGHRVIAELVASRLGSVKPAVR